MFLKLLSLPAFSLAVVTGIFDQEGALISGNEQTHKVVLPGVLKFKAPSTKSDLHIHWSFQILRFYACFKSLVYACVGQGHDRFQDQESQSTQV